jgi:hypothetical protein
MVRNCPSRTLRPIKDPREPQEAKKAEGMTEVLTETKIEAMIEEAMTEAKAEA